MNAVVHLSEGLAAGDKKKKNLANKEKEKKKILSEVGFEPTPTYVDQKSRTRIASKV